MDKWVNGPWTKDHIFSFRIQQYKTISIGWLEAYKKNIRKFIKMSQQSLPEYRKMSSPNCKALKPSSSISISI